MKLQEFLSSRQMSQAAFADLVGISQAAVSRYADHGRMPRKRHLERIREVTGGAVTADDFLSESFIVPEDGVAEAEVTEDAGS